MSILQKTVLASIGAFNLTKKKAEEVIDQLIKNGELTKSDRKNAVLELLDKADKSTADFRAKVTKEVGKVSDKIGAEVTKAISKLKVARQNDVSDLNKKFDKLLKSVARMEKKLADAIKK